MYCKKNKGVDHSTVARLHQQEIPNAQIAKRMGISRMSVYRSLAT
ncbi:MAG: helix-turn-helix domain-containing protein [Paracoccaceae bacterium]